VIVLSVKWLCGQKCVKLSSDDGVQIARPLAQPLCCLQSGAALCKVVAMPRQLRPQIAPEMLLLSGSNMILKEDSVISGTSPSACPAALLSVQRERLLH